MGSVSDAGPIGTITANVWEALRTNLGTSSDQKPTGQPGRTIGGFTFPAIPAGTPTTIIPIAFPLTTAGPSAASMASQESQILGVFAVAMLIWFVPWMCANSQMCCSCFRRFLSRRLRVYFCIGLLANIVLVSCVIAAEPNVSANDVFFKLVSIVELVSSKTQEVLMQLSIVFGGFVAYSFRQKVVTLLGFDSNFVRADLKDCLTCFSMSRYSTIEVAFLRASDLPSGFSSRSLFLRVILGNNEPLHSRPRDGCTTSMTIKERMQLNYDPDDYTQSLTIAIKQQEVVGQAVRQLAPAVGALAGGAAGLMTPLGPQGGAAIGAIAGIGTANSLGPEVARIDLSHAAINRLRDRARARHNEEPGRAMSTGPLVPWQQEYFEELDLVPQGRIWVRIMDR